MTTFLFWNLNRKSLCSLVANLVWRHDVDVLMLAESAASATAMLKALNPPGRSAYHYAPGLCNRIQLFVRFSERLIRPVHEADRLTIRHLSLPGLTDILLAVVHLPSKLYWEAESQGFECVALADLIRKAERLIGHARIVLVGDLNMNPFEADVVAANGLHGVMARSVAAKAGRTVQGKEYPFFYNPMWGLFGDGSPGPAGTYYRGGSEHVVYFWNMFDQVLVRPDLLDRFHNRDLVILHSDGDVSLLSRDGTPSVRVASDHLPVLFKLHL